MALSFTFFTEAILILLYFYAHNLNGDFFVQKSYIVAVHVDIGVHM